MINLFSQAKRMTNGRVEKYFCASSNRLYVWLCVGHTFESTLQILCQKNHKENKNTTNKIDEVHTVQCTVYTHAIAQLLYILLHAPQFKHSFPLKYSLQK